MLLKNNRLIKFIYFKNLQNFVFLHLNLFSNFIVNVKKGVSVFSTYTDFALIFLNYILRMLHCIKQTLWIMYYKKGIKKERGKNIITTRKCTSILKKEQFPQFNIKLEKVKKNHATFSFVQIACSMWLT